MKIEQLNLNKSLVRSNEIELGTQLVATLVWMAKVVVRAGRLARISFLRANFQGVEPRWEIRRSR